MSRELLDKAGQPVKNWLLFSDDLEEAALLTVGQFCQGLRRTVARDEVLPERQVRPSIISWEINPMARGITDLREYFTKSQFMDRLAVHNHAVHVENNRRKLWHAGT